MSSHNNNKAHNHDHNHKHSVACGHTKIRHDDHIDYVHDGHLHHYVDGELRHCKIPVSETNPNQCKPINCGCSHEGQC